MGLDKTEVKYLRQTDDKWYDEGDPEGRNAKIKGKSD